MYLKKLQSESFLIYKRYRDVLFIRFILKICSIFYFVLYKTRILLYNFKILKTHKLPIKVISIGNLTCGGTGKTPLTIELAKYLTSTGLKVAILSRGYKRGNGSKRNILVRDTEDLLCDYEQSGDEAYLIAKKLTKSIVLSGADRILASESAFKLGADIIILDDGYQYLRLHRDKNILLLDGKKPFDNGHLLPAGELRELPDSIKRATSIVISNLKDPELKSYLTSTINSYSPGIPVIEMNYKINRIKGINIVKTINPHDLSNKNIIAFSGIGNPTSFEESLIENGLNIIKHIIYEDHHNYQSSDISNIIDIALNNNIENIITTEKDTVKIELMCEGAPITFWQACLEVNWKTLNPFELLT